jgi:hypothetical protein
MKRLRATLDFYVNMEDGIDEESALTSVNEMIDHINSTNETTGNVVTASEVIQHEVYDEEGLDDSSKEKSDCPEGGDLANDCKGCTYSGDYHFVTGECLKRGEVSDKK